MKLSHNQNDVSTRSAAALLIRPPGHQYIMSTTTEKSYTQLLNKVSCPDCRNTRVRRATSTSELVYLRCEDCGHTWPIGERRRPRRRAPAEGSWNGPI